MTEELGRLVRAQLPDVTDGQIEDYCNNDWPEGQAHIDWLETASLEEVAAWVIEGLRNWHFEEVE